MASATYKAILDQVVDDIKMLDLSSIPDANIQLIKVENYRETVKPGLPGVLCSCWMPTDRTQALVYPWEPMTGRRTRTSATTRSCIGENGSGRTSSTSD